MLPRQNLGRGKHRALHPGLDRAEQRTQRDHRFARADIALQQPQHRSRLGNVAFYFRNHPLLRAGQRKGQLQPVHKLPRPRDRHRLALVHRRPHQPHGELVGKQFIIGQPVPVGLIILMVDLIHRRVPPRPIARSQQAGLNPFGQVRQMLERRRRKLPHPLVSQSFRQRIDRFGEARRACLAHGNDMVGVHHLQFIAIAVELAGNDPRFPHR